MELQYRADLAHGYPDELGLNECTIHRASTGAGAAFWVMWFRVARMTDGVSQLFAVPVDPGHPYGEGGPAGKTWGLNETSAPGVTPSSWQVSPSINVLDTRELHAGPHATAGSLWHETPTVVGVPAGERWMPVAP